MCGQVTDLWDHGASRWALVRGGFALALRSSRDARRGVGARAPAATGAVLPAAGSGPLPSSQAARKGTPRQVLRPLAGLAAAGVVAVEGGASGHAPATVVRLATAEPNKPDANPMRGLKCRSHRVNRGGNGDEPSSVISAVIARGGIIRVCVRSPARWLGWMRSGRRSRSSPRGC